MAEINYVDADLDPLSAILDAKMAYETSSGIDPSENTPLMISKAVYDILIQHRSVKDKGYFEIVR